MEEIKRPPAQKQASDQPFKTPEEVASAENRPDLGLPTQPPSDMPKPKQKFNIHWPRTRRGKIILASSALVLLIVVGAYLALQPKAKPVAKVTVTKAKPVVSKLVPSTLTGLPVDPAVNQRQVTAVMIENSLDARPQSGLSQAGVVFEALAEGGVSRFMALFQDSAPNSIGPIRSARPYYVQWALGFDAAYSHVGGSPDALSDIKSWGVKDLDEFYAGCCYQRISSRAAPHNVYSSIGQLNQLESSRGYNVSHYQGFAHQAAVRPTSPTATSINLTLSGPLYNPSFSYNKATNSYDRSEDGTAMVDADNNKPVSPTVVIAMVVPLSTGALDASGAYYSDYNVIGSGPIYVFQNGSLTTGQWAKSANQSQITFSDANGHTINLQPGQTWITAVGSTSDVSYH